MTLVYNSKKLGEMIRFYRTKMNLSQNDLGKVVNMSQTTISELELGKLSSITIDKLDRIAMALMVNLDDLLYYDLNKYKNNDDYYKIKINELLSLLNENQLVVYQKFLTDFLEHKKR